MKTREDWICEQLDNPKLSAELRTQYEAELDDIADGIEVKKAKRAAALEAEKTRRAEIRARILAEDSDYVQALGEEEFGSDYDIIEEGGSFVVYSKVARDDQEHRRIHPTLEAANADLRYLFYNRLYTKYVRTGEADNIVDLTQEVA